MGYEIAKTLHIIFVISWFAGLFYLPRIYVNLAMVPSGSDAERARLLLMARKLLRFMNVLMVPAIGFGLLLLWQGRDAFLHAGWMHAKLALVLVLLGFHHSCGRVLRGFEQGTMQRSHVWFRWYNEVPTLAMFAIVPLVVIKPF